MPKLRSEETGGLVYKPVDSAGRVAIPADFVEKLRGQPLRILWWVHPCIRIVTAAKLQWLIGQLDSYARDLIQNDWIRRRVNASVRTVTMDENNRVRIPPFYLDALMLPEKNKKVLVVPYDEEIVELWNPDTYQNIVLGVDFTGPYWRAAVAASVMPDDLVQRMAQAAEAATGSRREAGLEGEPEQ